MESLLDPESEALQTVLESGDERFVSVFLELMHARQIGIVDGSYSDIIKALEGLSGQDFGQDWPAWVEWYGTTELEPPPGTPLPSTACTGALDRSPIPMAARYGLSTVARRLFRPGRAPIQSLIQSGGFGR